MSTRPSRCVDAWTTSELSSRTPRSRTESEGWIYDSLIKADGDVGIS